MLPVSTYRRRGGDRRGMHGDDRRTHGGGKRSGRDHRGGSRSRRNNPTSPWLLMVLHRS